MDNPGVRDWFRAQLVEDAKSDAKSAEYGEQSARIGELRLAKFQQVAVSRGLKIARAYGGVLLADAVGLGKTRVGLAIAAALRRDARLRGANARAGPVLCCAPARLLSQWQQAAARAKIADFRVVSHTFLSRSGSKKLGDELAPSVILVDEAHRFRNPKTRRSRRLAELVARAPVVLMSATPVCNSPWDLYHLFSLFLADHDLRRAIGHNLREAFELATAGEFDLSELIEVLAIRRVDPGSTQGFGRRPDVRLEILEYDAGPAETWLWQHLGLEISRLSMALFRRDWPRHLLVEYVLKRWESGADALFATLVEMVDFHRRWLEADRHARVLSRKDFRKLFGEQLFAATEAGFSGDFGTRQAVFPFLYDSPTQKSDEIDSNDQNLGKRAEKLSRSQVEADLHRLEALAGRAGDVLRDGDDKRQAILDLIRRSRQKILVFTSFQHAAAGLYEYLTRRLGPHAPVGLVTGRGARATGLGKTSADEVVRRFAPHSNGSLNLPQHQQIDVLISTDCLAEGVNLQDCSRVVLADLPYSPLGVEQRIGRLLRPGGPSQIATVYLPRPSCWADSLGLRRRLTHKITHAAEAGAGFVAAAELASSTRELSGPPNPLAALTRQDALAGQLSGGAAVDRKLATGFWRAKTRRGPPRLWLRVAAQDAETERRFWCLSRSDAPAKMRLSTVIDALIRDADEMSAVHSVALKELNQALFEAGRKRIEAREMMLRAARLAPYPMRLDAPQRALWLKIREAVDHQEIEVDPDALQTLRRDLLRAFPRGVERNLEALAGSRLPPARLVAQTRTLLGESPRWCPQVRLKIVAGLELVPER